MKRFYYKVKRFFAVTWKSPWSIIYRLLLVRLDGKFYRQAYPDVSNAHYGPRLHFALYGHAEGRLLSPEQASPVHGAAVFQKMIEVFARERGAREPGFYLGPGLYPECVQSRVQEQSFSSQAVSRDLAELREEFFEIVGKGSEAQRSRLFAPLYRLFGQDIAAGLAAVRQDLLGVNLEEALTANVLCLQYVAHFTGGLNMLATLSSSELLLLSRLYRASPAAVSARLSGTSNGYRRREGVEKLLFDDLNEINQFEPNLRGDRTAFTQVTSMRPGMREFAISLLSERLDIRATRQQIYIAVPWIGVGGSDKFATALGVALSATFDVILLITDDGRATDFGRIPASITSVDISDVLSAFHSTEAADILYAVVSEMTPHGIVIVNSFSALEAFRRHAIRFAGLCPVAIALFCFDGPSNEPRLGYSADYGGLALASAKTVITDGHRHALELKSLFGEGRAIMTVLNSPITVPNEAWNVPTGIDRPVVLWIGRNSPQKRFDLVLSIANRTPDLNFYVWGFSASDFDNEVPSNLTFFGQFDDFDETHWRSASVLLLTSAWEGLPITILEAGVRAMPVVASSVGSLSELLDDSAGWLIDEVEDASAYVAAIAAVLANMEDARARGRELRRRIEKSHSWATFKRQAGDIFHDVS